MIHSRMDAIHHGNGNGEILDRAPPHDLDAERALVGSLILVPAKYDDVAGRVGSVDFYDLRNGILFEAIGELHRKGAVDATLLKNHLIEAGQWSRDPGSDERKIDAAYLAEVATSVPVAEHAGRYADVVRDLATKRSLLHTFRRGLQSIYDGTGSGDLVQWMQDQVGRVAERAGDRSFEGITLADLAATKYEIRYLVEGILVAGQPCVLAGPQKTLKTSILLDLAVALAQGGYFLGRFQVPEAVAVGVFTGESGLATVRETALSICIQAGYDPAGIRNLLIVDQVPQLASLDDLDRLRSFILDHALEVVVLDPCYLAMPGDNAGNVFSQGELLGRIGKVCADQGTTLILCHHAKKAAGLTYAPLELEHISWSGFAEFARQWLLVNRREPYEPGSGLHRLHLTVGGSAGHNGHWGIDIDQGSIEDIDGRRWQVDVLRGDEARHDAHDRAEQLRQKVAEAKRRKQIEADKQKIVRALAKFPAGETERNLCPVSAVFGNRFRVALAELVQDGDVVSCEIMRSCRKTPYDGWRLADNA